jgi:hypothetical protein
MTPLQKVLEVLVSLPSQAWNAQEIQGKVNAKPQTFNPKPNLLLCLIGHMGKVQIRFLSNTHSKFY